MDNSDNQQEKLIKHLQQTEINFHIAKLVVIIIVAVVASLFVILKIESDNQKTRNYVHCIVNIPYQQGDSEATTRRAVARCIY